MNTSAAMIRYQPRPIMEDSQSEWDDVDPKDYVNINEQEEADYENDTIVIPDTSIREYKPHIQTLPPQQAPPTKTETPSRQSLAPPLPDSDPPRRPSQASDCSYLMPQPSGTLKRENQDEERDRDERRKERERDKRDDRRKEDDRREEYKEGEKEEEDVRRERRYRRKGEDRRHREGRYYDEEPRDRYRARRQEDDPWYRHFDYTPRPLVYATPMVSTQDLSVKPEEDKVTDEEGDRDMTSFPPHVEVTFDNTFMEPESLETSWTFFSNIRTMLVKVFRYVQLVTYHILMFVLGSLLALLWAFIFGVMRFLEVWVLQPITRLLHLPIRIMGGVWKAVVHVTFSPFCQLYVKYCKRPSSIKTKQPEKSPWQRPVSHYAPGHAYGHTFPRAAYYGY